MRSRWLMALGGIVLVCLVALVTIDWRVIRPREAPAVVIARSAADAMLSAYEDSSLGMLDQVAAPPGESYGSAVKTGTLFDVPIFAPTTVWDYSWALAAMEDEAQLPGGSIFLPVVRALTNNLQQYWDAKAPIPAYAPSVHPGANAIKYFDDNAWVGLDLVTAYHLTGDRTYLERAEAVFRYEESGWDPSGGGIYWNDQRLIRSTPSTAPVAELAVYLYRDTKNASYLAWAERLYAWQESTLVVAATGEVLNSINAAGDVETNMWTYNQGTVIGAGVLLYEVTHERRYLTEAARTAHYVLTDAMQPSGAFVPQPEFNGVLVDNLQLLYQATGDRAIAQAIETNARLAWTKARNKQDLIGPNWQGGPVPSSQIPILTAGGGVRLMAVAASLAHSGFRGFWL